MWRIVELIGFNKSMLCCRFKIGDKILIYSFEDQLNISQIYIAISIVIVAVIAMLRPDRGINCFYRDDRHRYPRHRNVFQR